MSKLAHLSRDTLRERLDRAEDPKAVKRLMVALAYKDGVSVDAIGERYGFSRSTVYYWLDRLAERPLDEALTDDDRPGRPPELSGSQRADLQEALGGAPTDCGLDADEWTPELVREYVSREFGVTYSLGHARRLRRELGGD